MGAGAQVGHEFVILIECLIFYAESVSLNSSFSVVAVSAERVDIDRMIDISPTALSARIVIGVAVHLFPLLIRGLIHDCQTARPSIRVRKDRDKNAHRRFA